jgi:hypothetical protein
MKHDCKYLVWRHSSGISGVHTYTGGKEEAVKHVKRYNGFKDGGIFVDARSALDAVVLFHRVAQAEALVGNQYLFETKKGWRHLLVLDKDERGITLGRDGEATMTTSWSGFYHRSLDS